MSLYSKYWINKRSDLRVNRNADTGMQAIKGQYRHITRHERRLQQAFQPAKPLGQSFGGITCLQLKTANYLRATELLGAFKGTVAFAAVDSVGRDAVPIPCGQGKAGIPVAEAPFGTEAGIQRNSMLYMAVVLIAQMRFLHPRHAGFVFPVPAQRTLDSGMVLTEQLRITADRKRGNLIEQAYGKVMGFREGVDCPGE